jgi:hypothetical protein
MPMDPQLAAIYGTDQSGEDTEKVAAAELAEKLAAEGDAEVETDSFTPEQIEELAQAAMAGEEAAVEEPEQAEEQEAAAGDEGEEQAEESEDEEEVEEEKTSAAAEAQEKLAEADYLGRVMAHAYTQELRKIAAAEAGEAEEGEEKVAAEGEEQEEQVTALDQLATARAQEILKANGIEPEAEKTSASEEEQAALAAAVDARAVELLTQAGYTFEPAKGEKTAGKVSNFLKGVKDQVKSPDSRVGAALRRHGGKAAAGAGAAAAFAAGRASKKNKK